MWTFCLRNNKEPVHYFSSTIFFKVVFYKHGEMSVLVVITKRIIILLSYAIFKQEIALLVIYNLVTKIL